MTHSLPQHVLKEEMKKTRAQIELVTNTFHQFTDQTDKEFGEISRAVNTLNAHMLVVESLVDEALASTGTGQPAANTPSTSSTPLHTTSPQHGLKYALTCTRSQLVRVLDTFIHFTFKANKEFESISREFDSLRAKMAEMEIPLGNIHTQAVFTMQGDAPPPVSPTGHPPKLEMEIYLAELTPVDFTAPTSSSNAAKQGNYPTSSNSHLAFNALVNDSPTPRKRREPNWLLLDPCIFCEESGQTGQGHWSNECPDYTSFEARVSRVEERGLCKKCLLSPHYEDECLFAKECRFCGSWEHSKLLCLKNPALKEGIFRASGVS